MKLRNKKTGIVAEVNGVAVYNPSFDLYDKHNKKLIRDVQTIPTMYESLSELNEEWEDYTPKEPLIKDEKTRKAVRAWAYLARVGEDKVLYHIVGGRKEFEHYGNCLRFGSFDTYIGNVEDKTYYTITELCGEEE